MRKDHKLGLYPLTWETLHDNGATFGALLTLATNGTIGEAEGTEEGE